MVIEVRSAIGSDMAAVLEMIQELADFVDKPECTELKLADLLHDGGFTDNVAPLYFCFVAEQSNKNGIGSAAKSVIGYALCFYSYSTRAGKSLSLEDLYVKPSHRSQGIGKQLFLRAVRHANETECSRVELQVFDWNPARKFYEKLNAIDMTASKGYLYYLVSRETMQSFNE